MSGKASHRKFRGANIGIHHYWIQQRANLRVRIDPETPNDGKHATRRSNMEAEVSRDALAERFSERYEKALRFASPLTGADAGITRTEFSDDPMAASSARSP